MTIRIMKKLAYILLTLVATVMSLTACSDDYTPILTSTIAPELYDYTGDTIKSGNSVYTLNWSPIRFYTDNQTSPTSIGSYELQGVNYNIQIDTLGGDFHQQPYSALSSANVSTTSLMMMLRQP